MHPRNRSIILAFSLILVLAVSAMAIQPALADDSTPPPPAPSTGSAPTAPNGNNLPAKVPAGADVVVLDRSGNSAPLASQKAAQIVASGDPLWCPKGVAPKSSVGGCSPASTDFLSLETWLYANNKPKAGAIWIAGSYQSGNVLYDPGITDFTLNGSTLTNMSKFSLDINGGWSGISGSKTIVTTHPSEFDASLSIINWHAPITISDIKLTAVTANPYEAYALSVQTDKGGITLNRVQVIDNYDLLHPMGGAHLDTSAATAGHPAPVTVNDSVFNSNYGSGLYVQSGGAVKFRNLTADNNGDSTINGDGAYIDNRGLNPNQPVTLTGTNEFKVNFGTGLDILSTGAVSLNNITAIYNDNGIGSGYGTYITNYDGSAPSIVKLTGTNWFAHNAIDGLYIESNGNIYLNNITSTDNSDKGASLDNCLKPAVDKACATTGKTVTLTGINSFNRNTGDDGLDVSASGAISISQVTANNNGGVGVFLDNCAVDTVTLKNCTTPLPYNVTLTNASTFVGNSSHGLEILATGTVSLKNITASSNGSYGTAIYNAAHLLTARPVTIIGTSVFSGNAHGLEIDSYGAITLSNITADDNTGGFGAYLNNRGYNSNAGGATVDGATVITRMPVTLTGVNNFNNNYHEGLDVFSVGAISVSNITASNNGTVSGDSGVILMNHYDWYPNFGVKTPYAANVTISGFGTFENNGFTGLDIGSSGAVKLTDLKANYNQGYGADIETRGFLAPQSVTLTGVNAFDNNVNAHGLVVSDDGKIAISNLDASNNGSDGAYLDNFDLHWPNKFQGVTLTGFNTFQNNLGGYGLKILTDGNATMSHINADENTAGTGAYVNATRNVTLMCGSAADNWSTGFDLTSGATMTLTGVNAYYNHLNEALAYTTLHRTASCP